MKKYLQSLRSKLSALLSALLSPEPEIQEDYVDKVVLLLRRDFTTEKQNEILLSIGHKLSKLREKDMKRIEKEYAILQENTNTLKTKMAIS
jgi:hypothetical protein